MAVACAVAGTVSQTAVEGELNVLKNSCLCGDKSTKKVPRSFDRGLCFIKPVCCNYLLLIEYCLFFLPYLFIFFFHLLG